MITPLKIWILFSLVLICGAHAYVWVNILLNVNISLYTERDINRQTQREGGEGKKEKERKDDWEGWRARILGILQNHRSTNCSRLIFIDNVRPIFLGTWKINAWCEWYVVFFLFEWRRKCFNDVWCCFSIYSIDKLISLLLFVFFFFVRSLLPQNFLPSIKTFNGDEDGRLAGYKTCLIKRFHQKSLMVMGADRSNCACTSKFVIWFTLIRAFIYSAYKFSLSENRVQYHSKYRWHSINIQIVFLLV